jgi:hypothetical protein
MSYAQGARINAWGASCKVSVMVVLFNQKWHMSINFCITPYTEFHEIRPVQLFSNCYKPTNGGTYIEREVDRKSEVNGPICATFRCVHVKQRSFALLSELLRPTVALLRLSNHRSVNTCSKELNIVPL